MLHLRLQIIVFPFVNLSEVLNISNRLKSASDSLVFHNYPVLRIFVHLTLKLIVTQFKLLVFQIESGNCFAQLNNIQWLSGEQLPFHVNNLLVAFVFYSWNVILLTNGPLLVQFYQKVLNQVLAKIVAVLLSKVGANFEHLARNKASSIHSSRAICRIRPTYLFLGRGKIEYRYWASRIIDVVG